MTSSYDKLVERFVGSRPAVQCWSPTQYRVAYHGWHVHDGACSGAPFADGKTLESACAALLRQVNAEHVMLVEGDCDQPCANRYTSSPKARLAHGRLMAFIEDSAARVDRWPAWKRGLPPCPSEGCNMADGHPGECP